MEKTIYNFQWHNGKELLYSICRKQLGKLYGEQPPIEAAERMEKELAAICDNGYEGFYLVLRELLNQGKVEVNECYQKGAAAGSMVAYLCGITGGINPLPPHYRCINRDYTEFPETKEWFYGTLPEKYCPVCHKKLIRDGYRLDHRFFMGKDLSKEPHFDLCVKKGATEWLSKTILQAVGEGYLSKVDEHVYECSYNIASNISAKLFSFRYVEKDTQRSKGLGRFSGDNVPYMYFFDDGRLQDLLHRTERYSSMKPSDETEDIETFFTKKQSYSISRAMKDLPEIGIPAFERVLDIIKIRSFRDLVFVYCVALAQSPDCGASLDRINEEMPSCREDILEYLSSMGAPEEGALDLIEYIRKGRGGELKINVNENWKFMLDQGIPALYIKYLEDQRYIPTRANAIGPCRYIWKLVYYILHDPEAYFRAYIELNSDEETKKRYQEVKERNADELRKLAASIREKREENG